MPLAPNSPPTFLLFGTLAFRRLSDDQSGYDDCVHVMRRLDSLSIRLLQGFRCNFTKSHTPVFKQNSNKRHYLPFPS